MPSGHKPSALTFILLLASFWTINGQVARAWVSGVGDDANGSAGCPRTAPCRTFAEAILQTQVNGEVDALDSGSFGAFFAAKSLTIDGGPGVASVLVAGTNGFLINAVNATIIIRNVQFQGIGTLGLFAVYIQNAAEVYIENVKIKRTDFQYTVIYLPRKTVAFRLGFT